MFKGRFKGRSRTDSVSIQKVPLKGLFSDGIWRCDCDPRLPARRFQTNNGGKNQGRWFYRCQSPQPTRCKFFLWDDDAKGREMAAVHYYPRPEPRSAPHTPAKSGLFITPPTTVERNTPQFVTPHMSSPKTPSKSSGNFRSLMQDSQSTDSTLKATAMEEQESSEKEEFYDWPSSDDELLCKVASPISGNPMPPPEIPRKTLKTDIFSTPRKRGRDEAANELAATWRTPIAPITIQDDDVFSTPATAKDQAPNLFTNFHLPSPASTPTPGRFKDILGQGDIATQMLQVLDRNKVPLSPDLKGELRGIGNKHTLFTRGVINGRDASRASIKKKSEEIVDLQGAVAALQAERETNLALIRQLRRELAGG